MQAMISARSPASSMMLGMEACEVCSAADNAIEDIPGGRCDFSKWRCILVGKCPLLLFHRVTLRAETFGQCKPMTRLADLLPLAAACWDRRGD
jgi:hypothetical protein